MGGSAMRHGRRAMRDPNRIDAILSDLKTVWEACPDLRLGQLLVNLAKPEGAVPQIFYLEDSDLHEKIRAAIENPPLG